MNRQRTGNRSEIVTHLDKQWASSKTQQRFPLAMASENDGSQLFRRDIQEGDIPEADAPQDVLRSGGSANVESRGKAFRCAGHSIHWSFINACNGTKRW